MRSFLAVILMITTFVVSASPSAAAEDAWAESAILNLLDELLLLEEADAFTADPNVAYIYATLGAFNFADRNELIDELFFVEDDGVDLLFIDSRPISDEVFATLEYLSLEDEDDLLDGSVEFMAPTAYMDALVDLLRTGGQEPAGGRDQADYDAVLELVAQLAGADPIDWSSFRDQAPPVTTTAPAPVVTTVPPTTASTAPSTTTTLLATTTPPAETTSTTVVRESRSTSEVARTPDTSVAPEDTAQQTTDFIDPAPVSEKDSPRLSRTATTATTEIPDQLPLGASPSLVTQPQSSSPDRPVSGNVAFGLLGLALVLAATLTRRLRPAVHAPEVRRIGETGRKLTGASDPNHVVQIAVTDAVRYAEADCGAYWRWTSTGLHLAGTTNASVFAGQDLLNTELKTVATTGKSLRAVIEADSAIALSASSILACPVIADGNVVGVLGVVRDPSQPFDAEDEEMLSVLAPMTASALSAAINYQSALTGSEVDWLTRLGNRRKFDTDFATLTENHQPIAMAMLDVDHFKHFNDAHGHAAGDAVLHSVAQAVEAVIGPDDTIYRYGGEEFAIIMRASDESDAAQALEQVRHAVEQLSLPAGITTPVTISIGFAAGQCLDAERLLQSADRALYTAKDTGRNRVVSGGTPNWQQRNEAGSL